LRQPAGGLARGGAGGDRATGIDFNLRVAVVRNLYQLLGQF
jgi:hypothetical protein